MNDCNWHYQATGDETEIFNAEDLAATPLVVVPFLDSESQDEHQARAQLVVRSPGIARADRYDQALNAMQLPPNGDDYNAIIEMMNGAPYREPHKEGR